MLIDEFQHIPEILDAIKAELNRDTRPRRFVLTGSTRYTVLPQAAQSLTGRAHVVNVLPLSQGELDGHREHFIDLLWQDPERVPAAAVPACSRDEYVNRILAGGFPMILRRQTPRSRTSWFADYVDLVVMRDVLDITQIRQREALPRLLNLVTTVAEMFVPRTSLSRLGDGYLVPDSAVQVEVVASGLAGGAIADVDVRSWT